MNYAIENVKKAMVKDLPIFGICLGHQLLALSVGAKTYKLHNGKLILMEFVHRWRINRPKIRQLLKI
jgi:carbamoylphosphate synthase small subunit